MHACILFMLNFYLLLLFVVSMSIVNTSYFYLLSDISTETPDAASQPSQPTPCSHGITTTGMYDV